MILKKNKYLKHFIALIILASCSSTSKNIQVNSNFTIKHRVSKNEPEDEFKIKKAEKKKTKGKRKRRRRR